MSERPIATVNPPAKPPVVVARPPEGIRPINLALNESVYGASPRAVEAAQARVRDAHRYPDPASSELRAAIAETHDIHMDRIVCGNGSEELLDVVGRLFVRAGDAILISQSGFFQFALVAARLGADLIRAPEVDFTADADALASACNGSVKLLFLAIPNNPTGTVMPASAVEDLHGRLPKNVVLVLDCAYGEYMDQTELAALMKLAGKSENVIVTRTFSKAYGLAALRVGWCYAPAWMVPGLNMIRSIGNINAPAQAAAIAALGDGAHMRQAVADTGIERAFVADGLEALGLSIIRGCGNFVLTKFPDQPELSTDVVLPRLLAETGIILRPVGEPGFANWTRIGLGRRAENELLLAALGKLLGRAMAPADA